MKIPLDAIIPEDKFTRYLLVKKEYNDKSQFLGIAGYNISNYLILIDEIRKMTTEINAIKSRTDEYGTFYKTTGFINGITGIKIKVTIVWMQRKVDGLFQFVTLIPEKRG
jgi:hypothetical protein